MTWTVSEDNGATNVRAVITARDEMRQLVEALGRAEEKLPPPEPIDLTKDALEGLKK